jgi:hypothetical protein
VLIPLSPSSSDMHQLLCGGYCESSKRLLCASCEAGVSTLTARPFLEEPRGPSVDRVVVGSGDPGITLAWSSLESAGPGGLSAGVGLLPRRKRRLRASLPLDPPSFSFSPTDHGGKATEAALDHLQVDLPPQFSSRITALALALSLQTRCGTTLLGWLA